MADLAKLLAEIDKAYAEATPGVWERQHGGPDAPTRIASEPDAQGHKHTIAKFPSFNRRANSKLIALLHNHWPEIRAALAHGQSARLEGEQ